MIQAAMVFLLIFIAMGVPVVFAIGFSGVIALTLIGDVPTFMAVQQSVRGVNSWSLMACPLFILAGDIMAGAKLSDRILGFCSRLLSWMRGGVGCVCVAANMIFSAITGSGAAAISAVGSLTTPELVKKGYKKGFVAALIAGAGALGPIIPPSLNMIVYGSITGDSVGKLFVGGVIPGIIIGLVLMAMCFLHAKKYDIDGKSDEFSLRELARSFGSAFFAIITPLIIIGGVMFGIFTATEAGIVACVYGLFCGLFIYRSVKLRELPGILRRSVESSCMVLLIMGIAQIYGYIFAVEGVGDTVESFLMGISENPYVIMLIILGIMLIIGMFMDCLAATVVVMPVIYPIIKDLGIDPIQFGVMFSISTVVGGLTPPVGVYLFLSMDIAKAKFTETIKYMYPVIGVIVVVMVLIIFVPEIATFLPDTFM